MRSCNGLADAVRPRSFQTSSSDDQYPQSAALNLPFGSETGDQADGRVCGLAAVAAPSGGRAGQDGSGAQNPQSHIGFGTLFWQSMQ
jgi:hypothetical protein